MRSSSLLKRTTNDAATGPEPHAVAPEPPATARFDGVDTLRGISILLVILLHTYLRFYFAGRLIRPLLPTALFHLVFTNGNNGVTVFFAISGFLITLTSLRRFGSLRAMRTRAFYRIRFARIAPLLLAVLAILSALHIASANGFLIKPAVSTLPRALFAALTFHLNWLEGARGYLPANWDVLWSLSVEEMFYLFFPLACLVAFRARRGTLIFCAMLLAFICMGPFARTVWTAGRDVWQEKSYLGGMDCIALGCLTALLCNRLQQKRLPTTATLRTLQIIGALSISLILWYPRWPIMRTIGRSGTDGTVLALGACLFILGSVLQGKQGTRWTAPLRWFGRHSYELYMTHEFAVVWITLLAVRFVPRGAHAALFAWAALIVAISAALAALTARFFSEPMNRKLRGALPPTQRPPRPMQSAVVE